jgi:hypothetical protein
LNVSGLAGRRPLAAALRVRLTKRRFGEPGSESGWRLDPAASWPSETSRTGRSSDYESSESAREHAATVTRQQCCHNLNGLKRARAAGLRLEA